jgi:hypothetical protein
MWLAYILIPISLFLLALLLGDLFSPKEKMRVEGEVTNISLPSATIVCVVMLCLLIAVLPLLIAMIINGIVETWVMVGIVIAIIIAFCWGLKGCGLYSLIIVSDYIVVNKLFCKKKVCHYSDIAYFKDNSYLGDNYELVCYGVNEKIMFSIKGKQKGIAVIRRELWARGIPEKK